MHNTITIKIFSTVERWLSNFLRRINKPPCSQFRKPIIGENGTIQSKVSRIQAIYTYVHACGKIACCHSRHSHLQYRCYHSNVIRPSLKSIIKIKSVHVNIHSNITIIAQTGVKNTKVKHKILTIKS